jgi:hypothetical protein
MVAKIWLTAKQTGQTHYKSYQNATSTRCFVSGHGFSRAKEAATRNRALAPAKAPFSYSTLAAAKADRFIGVHFRHD